jgi:predicted GIY-YIG superfamily endonuclease
MLINNFLKTYFVYTIRCNKTGNKFVGYTSKLLNRIGNHVSSSKSGTSKCTSKLVLENNDFVTSVVLSYLSKLEAKQA